VDVPSKRIGYWLVILPVSTNDLPTDFLDGPTTLTAENAVMASNGTVLELVTAVPQPDVTTAPPSVITNGVNWSRTVTGFTGNRWDAWMLYVNGQVNGIEWEQFKDDVLIYNPALEADGFVFLPEKQYVLPQN
jgi:hypothetical protein